MLYSKAITLFFLIFLGAMAVQIVSSFILYTSGDIYFNDMIEVIVSIAKVYSIHISIIFAGNFFGRLTTTRKKVQKRVLAVSLVSIAAWNLVLSVGFIVLAFLSPVDNYTDLITFLDTVASNSAFIITGVLSYFFVEKSNE